MTVKRISQKIQTRQLLNAILASTLAVIVTTIACMIKFYAIGVSVTAHPFFCFLIVLLSTSVFIGGLLTYVIVSRVYLITHTKYYYAFLTVVVFVFIYDIMISYVSPLLMAPALVSLIIAQISAKKQDAYIVNMIHCLMVVSACVCEYILTNGGVQMLADPVTEHYLWYVIGTLVINIGTGALMPLLLRDKTKRSSFILNGFLLIIITVAMYVMLSFASSMAVEFMQNSYLSAISAFSSLVLALLTIPLIEGAFNLVTDNRLAELTNTSHPLIKRLAEDAPGTYNHSLSVANYAEMCAEAIGEDPYLARAAAYYHDIGKLASPSYFTENQSGGANPHDEILPEISAEIIRNHTTEGYKLCKKYKLPDEVCRVTIEHHGTLPIIYFYERAKTLTDGEVDIDEYCYHGSIPTTKIAAIIMICDSGEAAIRAMDRPDADRIEKLLSSIISDRIVKGQFNNCSISMRDLTIIQQTIISAYGGQNHRRIKYPGTPQ